MVRANPDRNFSLGIFAYHLYKPSINRFSHVNGKQPFFTDEAAKKCFPTSKNSPSVFPYLVKLNDNGSYHGLREPIRKLENHYHELKIY